MTQSVVVLEKDPRVASHLAGGLRPHFSVHLAGSREELRDNVARTRPEAVVLNIEHWLLDDVESIATFPRCPSCVRTASRMKRCGRQRFRLAPAMFAPPTTWATF